MQTQKFLVSFQIQLAIVKVLFCTTLHLDILDIMEFTFQCKWMMWKNSLGPIRAVTSRVSGIGIISFVQSIIVSTIGFPCIPPLYINFFVSIAWRLPSVLIGVVLESHIRKQQWGAAMKSIHLLRSEKFHYSCCCFIFLFFQHYFAASSFLISKTPYQSNWWGLRYNFFLVTTSKVKH